MHLARNICIAGALLCVAPFVLGFVYAAVAATCVSFYKLFKKPSIDDAINAVLGLGLVFVMLGCVFAWLDKEA